MRGNCQQCQAFRTTLGRAADQQARNTLSAACVWTSANCLMDTTV